MRPATRLGLCALVILVSGAGIAAAADTSPQIIAALLLAPLSLMLGHALVEGWVHMRRARQSTDAPPVSSPHPPAQVVREQRARLRLAAVKRELELKSLAIEASMDGVAILDAGERYIYVNRAHARVYGYEPEELIGLSWRVLYTTEEQHRFVSEFMPLLQRDGQLRLEATGRRKDGSLFPQELSLTVIPGGGLICVVRDITPRKEALQEAYRLASLARYNPSPLIRFNREGDVLSANPAAHTTLNLREGERGRLPELIPEFARLDLAGCIARGELLACTCRIGQRWYHFAVRGLPTLGFGHAYGSDITELRRAHEKLVESRKFLRKVIDSDPNLIFVKDSRGRFTLVNQAMADLYGTSVSELIGRTDADFNGNTEEVEHFRGDDRAVIERLEHRFIREEQVTNSAGQVRWLQTVKKPLVMNDTGEVRVLGVATDITERKILHDQLLQSQKMEAIGQLAGGISHDFNNLLTGIIGYTDLLRMTSERNPQVLAMTEQIENAAQRAAALTQKLLGFARKGKHQNRPVDLNATIDETMALLQRTVERNISIVLSCTAPNACVMGDPVQLQQIILNLAINARDAMSPAAGGTDGGEMSLATRLVNFPGEDPLPDPSLRPGRYLEVTVRDTGCGIPADLTTRIFEPFFTTKSPERGTGMGLAMVYGIVRNHGGTITVTSTVGEGSIFRIFLPSIEPVEIEARPAATPPRTGRGQVLVVDDHPVVRQVTANMLTSLGYGVVTAADGMEALECYRAHVNDIDLVILDMVMPRMGARECFRGLRQLNPGIRAILSTGYVNNNAVQEILNEGMCGFVQKPYQITHLAEVVNQVLCPAAAMPRAAVAG